MGRQEVVIGLRDDIQDWNGETTVIYGRMPNDTSSWIPYTTNEIRQMPINELVRALQTTPLVANNYAVMMANNPKIRDEALEVYEQIKDTIPENYVFLGSGGFLEWGTIENTFCMMVDPGGRFTREFIPTLPDSQNWFVFPRDSGMHKKYKAIADWFEMAGSNPETKKEPVAVKETPMKWNVSVCGKVAATLEEFREMSQGSFDTRENTDKACDEIWEILRSDNPDKQILPLITKYPELIARIDFSRIEKPVATKGVDIQAIAESDISISDLIIKGTAGIFLRGGMSDHFHYDEGGQLVIDLHNPPTLEQGYEIISRSLEVKEAGNKLENYAAWTLGMLGDQLEMFFGEEFDISSVIQGTQKAYNTYMTSVGVFRGLWANRRNVSFTHHKEAYYAKFETSINGRPVDPMQLKMWVLDESERLSLTVAEQRKLISYVRLYGNEQLSKEPPDSAQDMLDKVDVRSVNRNYIFYMPSEKRWYVWRGPFSFLPNGASPIIEKESGKAIGQDGSPMEISVWTPVGMAVDPESIERNQARRGTRTRRTRREMEEAAATDTE